MKAIVWHGVGDSRLDDIPTPKIEQPPDAIIRLTASATCGTDLNVVRGTVSGMKPGTTLGHEAVGIVEELSADVRCFDRGDLLPPASPSAWRSAVTCRSTWATATTAPKCPSSWR